MQTVEELAYEALSKDSYTLNVGGEEIAFRYATLDDLQRMSAIISKLPVLDEINKTEDDPNADVPQIVDSFKYAKDLGDIIAITAITDAQDCNKVIKPILSYFRKKKVLKTIYRKIKTVETYIIVNAILQRNHVFFYQRTITSLKGMNHLKPTKETDQTVHGQ